MESTTNVNEVVTPQNMGATDDVKPDQPTFEELADKQSAEQKQGTEDHEVSKPLEDNPETPGEIDVQVQFVDTERTDLEELESNNKPVEPELTPEEKIIDTWLQNGKNEVFMKELNSAGFEDLDPQHNIIGRFKLSRMLLVSPFKIEKINKDV